MKDFKIPESVLVLIHTAEQDVLLLERVDHPGFWQSVTGSLDTSDEPLVRTAVREVLEETGIAADVALFHNWALSNIYEIYPQWRHRYAPGVTHNTEHVFSLCVPRGTAVTLSPREHTAWQWLPLLEAADLCYSASNAEAILMLPQFMASQPHA
ncbi:MAG TPA: dihydroneopterin triphosphate diphosphatase [Polaromonas sp.]|uniref:dihydroneopterin triphosphate diphosphatase n=1 Tax=Polaromonas sp. TaxID=1869339 RepID=UPI002D5AFB3D|nr:dihydroneopterin triphosphate diphosphatase [Polaromonas sp.]HYW56905.1 dihydroneopterin triphosphate diphosphatase [Polaromonas sp.]